MRRIVFIAIVILALLGVGTYVMTQGDSASIDSSVALAEAMGGDTTGYARAEEVRNFTFPADHGPHPDFNTEWWYVTGNLHTESGRRAGYELTIFRVAMTPPDSAGAPIRRASTNPADTSSWAADQFYMAHFAVSDVAGEEIHTFERFSRGAAGLAGAQADPFRVWLEDWSMTGLEAGDAFPLRIRAAEDGIAIDLTLEPTKPRVLQGDRGLSQKGPGAGNASYYYSYTRLATEGQVVIAGDTLSVTGQSWMDREWSTSALGEDQVGWDWFALQLDDGRDLMYYQIRQQDGTPSPFTEGVLVGEDGGVTRIRRDDVTLEVLDTWTSPRGGTYPTKWRLQIPEANLDLTVTAFLRGAGNERLGALLGGRGPH